jgi:phosphomannomutase
MGRLFGTDGVRGLANEKLNCELVYKLGQARAKILLFFIPSIPSFFRAPYAALFL